MADSAGTPKGTDNTDTFRGRIGWRVEGNARDNRARSIRWSLPFSKSLIVFAAIIAFASLSLTAIIQPAYAAPPPYTSDLTISNIQQVSPITSTSAKVNYQVAALKDGSSVTVSCNPASGSILPVGSNTIECTFPGGVELTFKIFVETTAPIVTATPGQGTYESAQSVTLTSNEPGTTIRYTTNGIDPTGSSPQYTSPISISTTTTLKFFGVDTYGNAGSVVTQQYTFDTVAPTVTTTVNDNLISDSDIGGSAFNVIATFNEAMNPAVTPSISFAPPTPGSLTFSSGAWSVGNTVYTASYNKADAGVELADIDVSIAGGEDVAGNTQSPSPKITADLFSIDTKNPTLTIIASDPLITESDVGGPSFTVTATFSEAMDTASATPPIFSYNPAVGTTLTSGNGIWSSGNTIRTATYTIVDVNVEVIGIDVSVSGIKDLAGNTQSPSPMVATDLFSIDTKTPTVTLSSTAPDPTSTSPIPVTATFSESVTGFIGSDITVGNGVAGSLAGGPSVYTFNITPSGQGLVTVNIAAGVATDTAGNGNSAASQLSRTFDSAGPTVTGVSSTSPDGTYSTGTIPVTITFSDPVTVTGSPLLALNTNPARSATYSSGSGTATLTFNYVITSGDASADLNYAATTSLTLNGGTIKDAAANNAALALPATNAPNSLGGSKDIVIDAMTATVTSISSTLVNGVYGTGDTIPVAITFNEPVTVTGFPQLLLETGTTDRQAAYASGSGTATLTFNYVVQAGDASSDLDYVATTSLTLNGGTIKDAATNNAVLTLPAPGAANSLGANKAIVIDTSVPAVTSVSSTTANGAYNGGDTIPVTVTFTESVTVTGIPQIQLETGSVDRQATYSSGSGTTSLTFNYAVQAGDMSADLDYVSSSSLTLNGGTINDSVGNTATLTLPAPGAVNSLGANKAIVIDTAAPDSTTPAIVPNPANSGPTITSTATDSGTATSGIVAAEYFIDTVGAPGTGTPMSAADGTFNSNSEGLTATISTTTFNSLSQGTHTVYIRAKDGAGNWESTPSSTFVKDTSAPAVTTPIITPSPTTFPPTITSTATDSGTATSGITTAEYFVDTAGANGAGAPMNAVDGSFNSDVEALTVTMSTSLFNSLTEGTHTIYVHAKDGAGSWGPTSSATFVKDSGPPTVSIGVNDLLITDNDVGGAAFTVTATFSKSMDTTFTPTITFTPPVGTTLTFTTGTWSASNTVYTASYSKADAGVEVSNIDVSVGGAKDTNGNSQTPDPETSTGAFSIDTKNPTVTITSTDPLITDSDIGGPSFGVTATFSEPMDTSAATPIFSYNPAIGTTLTAGSGVWSAGNTIYTATYVLADANVEATGVDASVSGLKDAAGNTIAPSPTTSVDLFSVDTKNPTVTPSPVGGTFGPSGTSVALAASEPATIHYTLDDSTPSGGSSQYTSPIDISTTTTVKYFATDSVGNSGAVQTQVYTIDNVPPIVNALPAGGTYTSSQSVTLSSNEPSTIIRYTTNGNDPTGSSSQYASPISITVDTTLKFFGTDSFGNVGSIVTQVYDITGPVQPTGIVMQDTTTGGTGWGIYSTRPVLSEYVSPSSALVGKYIDSITVNLKKGTSTSTGTAFVGIINSDLSMKKTFATISISSLSSSSYVPSEYKLAAGDCYQIQAGDRIGVKNTGGSSSSNYLAIMRDINTADPYDGTNSHLTYYTSSWAMSGTTLSYDLVMTLKYSGCTTTPNNEPTANAGPDQSVNEGTQVTLDGTGSTDTDGTIASYSWTQTSGPSVTLSSSSGAQPTFTAPSVGASGATLVFSLGVTDNQGATDSTPDAVSVTVNNVNQPPVANAGSDQTVSENTLVTLTGLGSTDDGSIASYAWSQTGGPAVTLSSTTASQPTFTAPSVSATTVLTFSLTVTDNNGATDSTPDTVQVTVNDGVVQQPGIVMQDTTTGGTGWAIYSGRPVIAEYVSSSSALVGKQIDSITINLKTQDSSSSGTAIIGIINADLTIKKAFATINISTLTTSYAPYEFKLLSTDPNYVIQSGDRIGVKYTSGTSSSNNVSIMRDINTSDPYDGTNTHLTYYTSSWAMSGTPLSYDLVMTLKMID